MAKIYIAGKVTGIPAMELKEKFDSYNHKLHVQGHEPVNPINLCRYNDPWHFAMRKCISAMVLCDEIHFLPCWKDSPGAHLEYELAKKLKIKIVFV